MNSVKAMSICGPLKHIQQKVTKMPCEVTYSTIQGYRCLRRAYIQSGWFSLVQKKNFGQSGKYNRVHSSECCIFHSYVLLSCIENNTTTHCALNDSSVTVSHCSLVHWPSFILQTRPLTNG